MKTRPRIRTVILAVLFSCAALAQLTPDAHAVRFDENDLPIGPIQVFYDNGRKKFEANFEDGQLEGTVTEWYESGKRRLQADYRNGKLDGHRTEYYENGRKRLQEFYEEGTFVEGQKWSEDGRMTPARKRDPRIPSLALLEYGLQPVGATGGGDTRANTGVTVPKGAYDQLLNAVVIVEVPGALGSGFAINDRGRLLTNHHVVDENPTAHITFRDGKQYEAKVLATDKVRDLALLQVEAETPAFLILGTTGDTAVGDEVVAIGAPKGLSWTLTKGIVSAIREMDGVLCVQTDAAVNSGNSGGPLIHLGKMRVLGVNSFVIKKDIAEGLNFAVSGEEINAAFPVITSR